MSKPDTFAEVVRGLVAMATSHAKPSGQPTPDSDFLDKAARLLAAAGEEVRAWRAWKKCVVRYMTAEVPSPHEKIERMQKARAALNALAPELKENTDGST